MDKIYQKGVIMSMTNGMPLFLLFIYHLSSAFLLFAAFKRTQDKVKHSWLLYTYLSFRWILPLEQVLGGLTASVFRMCLATFSALQHRFADRSPAYLTPAQPLASLPSNSAGATGIGLRAVTAHTRQASVLFALSLQRPFMHQTFATHGRKIILQDPFDSARNPSSPPLARLSFPLDFWNSNHKSRLVAKFMISCEAHRYDN